MRHRAQGTIEYLVIIAIVVVIALVVVGLLLQVMGQGSAIPETAAQTAWKSATPWSVTWSQSDTNLVVAMKNSTYETLALNAMCITSTQCTSTGSASVAPGATVVRAITVDACSNHSKYSHPKATIYLDYNST